jgi:RNA polymerase sigma-70 factor (ECF subfamily)
MRAWCDVRLMGGPEAIDALAERCRDGDDAALDAVLRQVRPAVLRYLLAQGLPVHDADDVAQEVCLGVSHALPGWSTGRQGAASVWSCVFTGTRRRLVDRARRRERQGFLTTDDGLEVVSVAPGPEDLAVHAAGLSELRNHLDALPHRQRDVLLLRVVVGLDVAETAAALGLARGSVHVLQHRALSALRASYGRKASR